MKLLKDWIDSEIKPIDEQIKVNGFGSMLYNTFHRDKHTVIHHNSDIFYSPANGTVIYSKEVKDINEKMLDIKGQPYSLLDLVEDEEYLDESEDGYLVIGVFLTLYDVHTVKIPAKGYIRNDYLPCIKTNNLPMNNFEFDVIKHQKLNFDHLDYIYENERMISTIYNPTYQMYYNIVSISDRVVNTVIPYCENCFVGQGQTFGRIIYGSQVDLIVPLNKSIYDYKFTVPSVPSDELYHVESGVDPLIRLFPHNT